MPSALKKTSLAVGTTRTTFITAAAAKQTIVITGTVSNVDSTNKATHFVTVEVGTGGTYRKIVQDAPVPYGGALVLDKIVLVPGDVLTLTSSTANALEGYISYVEKD